MQYIDYDYACKNNLIKEVMINWLDTKKQISWQAKHHILLIWRRGGHSLIIGNRPDILNPQDLRNHYKKIFHKQLYTQKYLERNLFKL